MEGGKPFHSPPPPPPPQLHHAAKIIKQPIYQACIMYLAKTMRPPELALGQYLNVRCRASRPRASRQSVPFNQSAQQMAW